MLCVDGRMEAMAAEVDPLARDLDAGRHAADVVGGLDHDHLVTRTRRTEGGDQPGGAGADHHKVGRRSGPRRRAKMGCWRLLH